MGASAISLHASIEAPSSPRQSGSSVVLQLIFVRVPCRKRAHARRSSTSPSAARTGLGLFTNSPIEKGAVVIEYIGKTLTKAEYDATNSKYLFELGPKKKPSTGPRWNTARYINHSCKPNCTIDIHKRRAFIRAKRAIEPGEELMANYGKNTRSLHQRRLPLPQVPAAGRPAGREEHDRGEGRRPKSRNPLRSRRKLPGPIEKSVSPAKAGPTSRHSLSSG